MEKREGKEGLGQSMLPFVMRDLVGMVIRKKSLVLDDALHYIYTTKLYKSLLDESKKQWYSSTLSLYEALEKEKAEERKKQNGDPKVLMFKVFCIESYRQSKRMSAEEVLLLFSENHVLDFLEDTFEMLHTQDAEYILDTITTYLNKKK